MVRTGLLRCGVVALAVVVLIACGEELVVRESTRVYRDGSVFRSFEITGREGDGELPEDTRWLEDNAGLVLAEPDRWDQLEERPGYVSAEQTFGGAEEVPPLLAHAEEREQSDSRELLDRSRLELRSDDLVVLHRWVYRETRGDPYGIEELDAALDALVELGVRFLGEEVRREFGSGIDPSRAEAFLRGEVRSLASDVLRVMRRTVSAGRDDQAARALAELLVRHGIVAPGEIPVADLEGDDVLEYAGPAIQSWMLAGIARGLSTAESPVEPADLDFWPGLEEIAEVEITDEIVDPRAAEFYEIAESLLNAMSGYYGNEASPRFRFVSHLEMPGHLLRTNGTPAERGVVWLYRNVDLVLGDVVLEAETVVLDDEALRTLGARRDFDTARLVQLVDVLSRDASGELLELLSTGIDRGRLDVLTDDDLVTEDTLMPARELHELLDPTHEAWPN